MHWVVDLGLARIPPTKGEVGDPVGNRGARASEARLVLVSVIIAVAATPHQERRVAGRQLRSQQLGRWET